METPKSSAEATSTVSLWRPPHRSCHLPPGKAECSMHASIASLLLYEHYVCVSLGALDMHCSLHATKGAT